MSGVSSVSVLSFLALVALVAGLFLWALAAGARRPGEDPAETRGWALTGILLLAIWLVPSAVAAWKGWLTFTGRPPTFFVLLALTTVATTILAFSPAGTRLVAGIGVVGLVGFQAFRTLLELVLHRLFREGAVPIQMTFAGSNFDIVTGILALGVIGWSLVSPPPRWAILGFNGIGLALLVTIVSIAILSMPMPWRRFPEGPSADFVTRWPFVWLPTVLVQAAWFGHLLVFRKLASR